MGINLSVGSFISCLLGILFIAIDTVNMFWGNDPFFGLFIILLSVVFFPPVTHQLTKWIGFRVPWWLKALIAIFILWAAVGVGGLFDKVDMMIADFT